MWSSDTEQADFAQAGFLSLSLSPGAWSLYFSRSGQKTGSPDHSGADHITNALAFSLSLSPGQALEFVLFQIWSKQARRTNQEPGSHCKLAKRELTEIKLHSNMNICTTIVKFQIPKKTISTPDISVNKAV